MRHLPIYLNVVGISVAERGDFTGARAVIAEADAIVNATGTLMAPTAAALLACLRGREPDAIALITTATSDARVAAQ
jgi:hypothetical protein